jgi:superfamily II RNA helicase
MNRNISEITGFPLDSFQKKAEIVILSGDDLLTTLPTGSGKTVVALIAIIRAFDNGHRAILTTPIKALSNQKYSEFKEWLSKAGYPNRITLLTGDIQSRATPPGGDGLPELLIMTSEILANKLERSESIDSDLINVSALVIDEMHYINDVDRGHVWERTIMNLPTNIQITALSATLSEPEKFQEWLSRRRPTQLVQRKDRHVPLHFGFFDTKQNFVELYSTQNENKTMDSAIYKKLQVQSGTFTQAIGRLVRNLEKEEKLPAIVFIMSKMKCIEAANSISQQLLYGPRPVMDKDMDPLEFGEIESEHKWNVKTIRNKQDEMYSKYLQPYHSILTKLPGFTQFKEMLDRGVAYHHAGLIPILREYVEILFSQRLLKVVFATESLAIGINMPTKCVVFTSLEKPSVDEMSMLKPEQFIQMAGRSGRRGIDSKGYVVYFPIKKIVTDMEFRHLLFGKMPSAVSTLTITPHFILKTSQHNIKKSLLFHQQHQYIVALQNKVGSYPEFTIEMEEMVTRYLELKDRLQPSMFKLSNSDRKAIEKEIATIIASIDIKTINIIVEKSKAMNELDIETDRLNSYWKESMKWLVDNKFINMMEHSSEQSSDHSIKGKIASRISDCCPLIRATMIEMGMINSLSFEEIVGWLGYFTEPIKIKYDYLDVESLEILDKTQDMVNSMEEYHKTSYETGLLLYSWAKHKDIITTSSMVGDFGNIGTFIRCVLRVISMIEELKPILLGLEYYELYNKLDNHQDKLIDGIVTNSSLYITN